MSVQSHENLFTPFKLGALALKHRVVMPPMSRLRAQWPSAKPSDLMVDYYGQRASEGGLIFAEMTAISPEARAYHTGPGLYSDEQVETWKGVTDAVHAKGGFIFVQLSHAGRATHHSIGGKQPVSSSVNPDFWADESIVVSTPDGFSLPAPHRALDIEEIHAIVEQYREAASKAKAAGFDGVDILAGNGHLIEQFLQNGVNKRTDEYGGSPENRERFLIEVLAAVIDVWGSDRVGVRISPSSTFSGMGDSDPRALFRHVAERLNETGIAYLHIIEPRIKGADTVAEGQDPIAAEELSKHFHGSIIAAGGFTPDTAEATVAAGNANLVAFGRHFTSNPDLPERIRLGRPLTHYDRNTFYAFDAVGYTDFEPYQGDVELAERETEQLIA